MQKLFTLLILLSAVTYSWAQEGLNLDFSDPAQGDRFNFIVDSGSELIEKSVSNGELKIVLNKKEWHFFQIWVHPLDFVNHPSVSFKIKVEQSTPIRMWVKQPDGEELTIFEQTVEPSNEYQTFNYHIENVAPLTEDIQEVGIDLGGYQVPPSTFAGTVYFDEFKLGGAAAASLSLDLDFSDAAQTDRLNFIVDTGGEVTKSTSNGVAEIVLNKKEWHFFQIWVNPLDFIRNPYLRVALKTDQDTPLRIWVTQQDGAASKDLYNSVVPASADFQTIQVSLDDAAPLTGYIQELNFDFGGYQVPPAIFSGTIYLDEIKLGEAAKPAQSVYGTSYEEHFSSSLYAGWASGDGFSLSREGEALEIAIAREVPVLDGELNNLASLSFEGSILDISASPYVNLDIKATEPFEFSVIAVDNAVRWKEFKTRVVKTDSYQTISLDLSTASGIDLSKIEKFYLGFNRAGFNFQATARIDHISIGDQANNLATMDAVPDKTYYKNSGNQEILLTHIHNATSISVDTTYNLIENVSVSPISGGTATLTFVLKEDATGSEPISLKVNGGDTHASNVYTFDLAIEDNTAPTLDPLADLLAETNHPVKIRLAGISDGNVTIEQPLTFKVTSSNSKIISGKVSYKGEGPYADLYLLPKRKGSATVTVSVSDDGDVNQTKSIPFKADVYRNINQPPAIDPIEDREVYQDAGPSSITLTGIGDGDRWSRQGLTFTVTNSDPSIVTDVSMAYESGNTATLYFTPVAHATGTTTITITVKDNGGDRSNQGDVSIEISFNLHVLKRPVTGYTATLDKSIEGFSANDKYTITEVDSTDFKALVFQASDKFYWDGVTMDLPQELDLSEHPYLTMEVYPIGQNTLHWIWFYDANDTRNELNNISKRQSAVAGRWNKLVFDFSSANDWLNNETNAPINNRRISRMLFDMHNTTFSWPPPPNYTGTFIVRNIHIGSDADYRPTPAVSINPVADQARFTGKTGESVTLTGISNGAGSIEGVTLTLVNSNPAVMQDPVLSSVQPDGTATLHYNTGSAKGSSTITITASASGATPAEVSFEVNTLPDSASGAAVITLHTNERHQRMYGIGTFAVDKPNVDFFAKEMGGSAMRIGIISNQWEPVNDNDDPDVLNMEGFNYDAFDWNTFRELKEKGVEHFILTSWSPPAWMKTNLSVDYFRAGYTKDTDNTTNRLDYTMYDEFAESMVAVVKAFKQRAGIDLLAIGLQNEPAFHEPYPSAILGPDRFVEMIKVAGRRFQREGIATRLYMPEQVSEFVEDNTMYLDAVQADAEANQYCDIFAIHGYGSDGITAGQPNFSEWENYRSNAAEGDNPKDVWMTETHKNYNSFEDALSIAGAIYGALEHGNVSLWTQWVFDGPFVNKGQPTGMLYAMSNFAKFIRPGDVRITSASGNQNVLVTSFINEWTGRTSVVLINKSDVPITARIEGDRVSPLWVGYNTAANRDLEKTNDIRDGVVLLPAKSITTLLGISFVWGNFFDSLFANDDAAEGRKGDRVYPNPSNGIFYLNNNDVVKVEITGLDGNTYRSMELNSEDQVSVSGLKPGIYIIRMHDKNGGERKQRVVIK